MVERMGKIEGMDEFALLLPILKKLMVVLEFDIMDSSSGIITQSRKEFWAVQMVSLCIKSHFKTGIHSSDCKI
jgi:hypothetical protein